MAQQFSFNATTSRYSDLLQMIPLRVDLAIGNFAPRIHPTYVCIHKPKYNWGESHKSARHSQTTTTNDAQCCRKYASG